MSRYELLPPGWSAPHALVVGWDDALESYFSQVIDTSISQNDECLILSLGGEPPRFRDPEALLRVTNRRIADRLPPVRLPPELLRTLMQDANRTVVNAITVMPTGHTVSPTKQQPASRPWRTLGATTAYLSTIELQEELDGMADQYHRLKALYLAKKAAGLDEENDERTELICQNLGQMGVVCQTLASMAHVPDILVAKAALKDFQAFSAEASHILHAESAGADALSKCLH
jgi:hypothetical protein